MLSAKQGNYWYHFYNVFGMTRSLAGDWTRDIPHSKPALYHKAIEEAVMRCYHMVYISGGSVWLFYNIAQTDGVITDLLV